MKLLNATPCVKGNLLSHSLSKEREAPILLEDVVKKKKKKKRDLTCGSSRRERCYDAEFFTSLWQGMDLIILMYPRKTSIRDKFPLRFSLI